MSLNLGNHWASVVVNNVRNTGKGVGWVLCLAFNAGFVACVLGGLLFSASGAWAQGRSAALPANVFTLSATAEGEATNDLMHASVVVEGTAQDSAELQSQINASTQWALARLRPYTSIKVKTQDYQTYPNYDREQKTIVGWRASQTLRLESDDVKAVGDVIRKLQERLSVRAIRFEPKPETRRVVEDQLINDALDAFKQRAQLIRTNMGASGYSLLDIDVQTGFQGGLPTQLYQERAVSQSTVVTEPGLQGGTSKISVQVYGRIQLGTPR